MRLRPGLLLHVPFVLAGLVVAGCAPTVGTRASNCNEDLARTVVYQLDGTPAYIGQAMLIQSCSGGGNFCHSEGAMNRYGAPFGLDFDAALAAEDVPSIARLARIQLTIHDNRNDIYAVVVNGSMPPGAVGDALDTDRYFFIPDPAVVPEPLPAIDSPEGRESLRNWLACGSPVIERSEPVSTPLRCTSDAECVVTHRCDTRPDRGVCVGVGEIEPALDVDFEPTWPIIYHRVIEPSCATDIGCHGPEPRSADLDMSTEDLAHASLVGVAASTDITLGGVCGDMGFTRVVPGDPEGSLLMHKLEDTAPPCGSAMPFSGRLNDNALSAIRDWIAMGAAR